ncbi:glycosyltransferase family 4 protein [Ohtaekwangia kribbensis]|jgi:glycosyltransferase involved in cell wall biosynthesis|uniref:Glycosyltransferase family 4 protein n=1 Tax=Ohtaekwangia kribbensis TaxID=688913 RepID=A0ABW3KA85_9BACT
MIKKPDSVAKKSAIFIMPRSSKAWVGAEALWITVAGWSAAAARKFGNAWVLTSDRVASPEEVIHYPLGEQKPASTSKKKTLGQRVPLFIKTLLKDILLWRKSRQWNINKTFPWSDSGVAFVWQQHDLFEGPGKKIAAQLGVPLIVYVHAPVVWEAGKWGVKRPIWGVLLEKYQERKALQQADIVACVSEDVARKVIQMGIDPGKVLISPMSVDPFLFGSDNSSLSLRQSLGLDNKFVLGWTGSFRSFHGLDILINVFNKVYQQRNDAVLLLVGDGQEREGIARMVKELDLEKAVMFLGKKPFAEIPKYVSLFDIAIVSARSADDFHYSPLKLREYLAAGKPTLAPQAGEIPVMFSDNNHLLLYKVGDIDDSASKIITLMEDLSLRERLSRNGANYILSNGTWDYEMEKALRKIESNTKH